MSALENIVILGGGAWGTALAHAAALAGRSVTLWARDASIVESLNSSRENPVYLPGVELADGIRATTDLDAVRDADAVLLVTPARTTAELVRGIAGLLPKGCPVVLCAKGLAPDGGGLLSGTLRAVLPDCRPAALSGPSFADDVARGLPTAVTIAAEDEDLAFALAHALSGPTLRPYASTDLVGVQVGGALKNVLAIGCGIVEGRGLGASARAALVARGFAELSRVGRYMGAKSETLVGLSGLGDLVLTCTSIQSRNFAFGVALGEGKTVESLLGPGGKLVEGAFTASLVVDLAAKAEIRVPISEAVAAVLAGKLSVDDAVAALMARPLRREDG